MTDKQLKLIYEYMGWTWIFREYQCHPLDSNSAWECVQEMERKGDWENFFAIVYEAQFVAESDTTDSLLSKYILNPDNFFNCMAKWLEGREK